MQPKKNKVQVWIFRRFAEDQFEILLLKMVPERGGHWQPVTGGVEEGELIGAAALREATEETSLKFRMPLLDLDYHFNFKSRWGGEVTETAYLLEADPSSSVKIDAREHVDFEWVKVEEGVKAAWAARLHYASIQQVLAKVVELLMRKALVK
jgi:8-oxo-dGTP pyrophosphatase MutT (NUDIX family)